METKIKIYGTKRCHKTKNYKSFFETRNINYAFYDVEEIILMPKNYVTCTLIEKLIFQP
jgi:mycoredoxin